MSDGAKTFAVGALCDYAARLLEAGGFKPADARSAAELLVWANLRGVDSHGVLRIPRYIEMVGEGEIDPDGVVQVMFERGATALMDAGLAPGATSMTMVADKAQELATTHGIGLCVARRTTHAGAIGFFAQRIAGAGMLGIVTTASKPLMAYPGALGEAISTNPLAIAAPSVDAEEPIVLDMSTGAVALGKIMAARDAGRSIPLGWAVDEEGRETTDPAKVDALLPMAGHKGAGLSLMIEILSSLLAGNPLIAPALGGDKPKGFNGFAIAIDPAAFGDETAFVSEVHCLAGAIHGLRPAEAGGAVLLPGERGRQMAERRRRDGITIAAGTAKKLSRLAEALGVDEPATRELRR